MERCHRCSRYLLVGELFRRYRRPVRGAVSVCALCEEDASERGWAPLDGTSWRQLPTGKEPVEVRSVWRSRELASMPAAV